MRIICSQCAPRHDTSMLLAHSRLLKLTILSHIVRSQTRVIFRSVKLLTVYTYKAWHFLQ